MSALVVPPQKIDFVRKIQFQLVEKDDNFYGELPSVHKVSEKQVSTDQRLLSASGRHATHIYQLEEIVELSMDVTHDHQRVLQVEEVPVIF